ncbi:MAG: helix-turn-helix domain-containing protein [Clostridiales bacterium]|jgi:two-component system response regulator YesN|nr:helix-turn-helix domain-containing protein [Clostridiales bacterium]
MALNAMLVDSDSENIRNFRAHIRGAFPDIRVAGSFSDQSKDILPYIRECGAQLIIADIRFFGGVRFMRFKEIHDEYPEIRFIVYGTFNDSDYMKRAREFGVLDFIYRPVKPAELNRCLAQALEHFKKVDAVREQKKILTQNYQERIYQYEELFLRTLLDGHLTRENEIRDGFSYFNIPFDKGFSVILIRTDHFGQITLALSEMEKHMLVFKMFRIVQEELLSQKAQAFIRGFNEIAVILGGYHSVEEKVLLCDTVKQKIREQADTRVTLGIGRTYDNPADIAVSCREADAAFRYRTRMGYNAVIPIEFVEPGNEISYRYPAVREDRLVHTAVAGDYNYSRNILNELVKALSQSGPLPEGLVVKWVMTIVFRISRYLSEQNLPIAKEVAKYFPTAEILALNTLEDGSRFLEGCLKRFCEFIDKQAETAAGRLHDAAKEYVRAHYFENFSIAKIAVMLNTTPENLNKVFMERERMMLFDFVMWARVYEAQNMLKDTDLDEEAIAVKVGFDDVKYFRSIFKKYQGDMPADYRARS